MQHYIAIKRIPPRPRLSLGILDEPPEKWERRAKALRIRRERLLRQQLRMTPR